MREKNDPGPSDGQLLAAFRGGERAAFESLVNRHQAGLLRHARAVLGDGAKAEDAVQETFLRLVQRPPLLERENGLDPEQERAHLLAWLHRVLHNACMDVLRSDQRRRHREQTAAAGEACGGGMDGLEANETRAAIERGLSRLSTDQREVLVLRLLGERSYREIADITGKKIGTVGWLVSTGLRALASELEFKLGAERGRAI